MAATISIIFLVTSSLLILVGVPLTMYYLAKLTLIIKRTNYSDTGQEAVQLTVSKALISPDILAEAATIARSALVYWAKRLVLGLVLAVPAILLYPL